MTKYIAPFALLFSLNASAGIYVGDVLFEFRVDRPEADFHQAIAQVDKVVLHYCDTTTQDYPVEGMVDLDKGFTVEFDEGDLCSAEVVWASAVLIAGTGFTVEADLVSTTVSLDPIADTALPGYKVTSGSMPNPTSGPRLIPTHL